MRKYIYFIALICCALSASTSYAQKKVIKTMMIAGQDGSHYWRGACEVMKQILENSGMFKVDFVFTPDFGGDINTFKPDFAKYNLVVVKVGSINSIFYFLHKAAEPFNCLEQDNLTQS